MESSSPPIMMGPWARVVLALACAAGLASGCRGSSDSAGDDEGEGGQRPTTPAAADPAKGNDKTTDPPVARVEPPLASTFLTYNVGLLPAVGLERERLPALIDALKTTRASVACLQEVWTAEDVAAITQALEPYYPHHYWERTESDAKYESGVCKLGDALAVQTCAGDKCTPNGTSITECVSDASLCKAEYDAFSDECKRCLAVNVDAPTGCATGAAPKVGNGGHNGLLLLSWHPIEDARYAAFDTQLVNRGVITATIEGRAVQCTHLSADLDVVPYPEGGAYRSWGEEHGAELGVIEAAAPAGDGCRVLLGDMNTGPTQDDLIGEIPENFPAFAQGLYEQSWATPMCTFCPDNPLAGVTRGRWIDHVFFKGCPKEARYKYQRVFDHPIKVEGAGRPVDTRLSDHYGLLVEATGL